MNMPRIGDSLLFGNGNHGRVASVEEDIDNIFTRYPYFEPFRTYSVTLNDGRCFDWHESEWQLESSPEWPKSQHWRQKQW